jgi:hypothetical protein
VSWFWGQSVCWGLLLDLPHKAQLFRYNLFYL